MSTERWQQLERIFAETRELPVEARVEFVAHECGADDSLRRDALSLLAADEATGEFMVKPALDRLAQSVASAGWSLQPGENVGAYTILRLLGAGGAGEVWRARDERLRRDVAIKILLPHFSSDAERLRRFADEARTAGALNHTNILTVYDVGEHRGIPFLVSECLEGQNLRDRIDAGPVLLDEAVTTALGIARGLAAAHARGIVHRDLKPENTFITSEGSVKILDFGIAKLQSGLEGRQSDASHTLTGVIVGTAGYMAPEQVKSEPVDARTDLFALGVMLYEMLGGRHPFRRASTFETLHAVLTVDPPDLLTTNEHVPMPLARIVMRLLKKTPEARFQSALDLMWALEQVAAGSLADDRSGSPQDARVAQTPAESQRRLAWPLALALVSLIAGAIGVWALAPVATAPEVRLEINTPPTTSPSLAIAPDGLKMVFVARSAGQPQLWLRSLDSSVARPLAGTERASLPFWSPDSRSIGFFAGTRLKRMSIDGGSGQTLVSDVPVPLGGAWNSDGTILFSKSPGGPIFRISAEGGEPVAATQIKAPQQRGHSSPRFLPDGRHFLFFVTGSPEARGVYVGQLDALDTKRLFDANSPATYASTGHVLFIREGKLLAQDFDVNRLELRGEPFPIAELPAGLTTVSTSAAGPVAYRTSAADSGQRQLVWVDRSNKETDKVVYRDGANVGPSLSRDGRRVAVYRFADGNMDIWSYDVSRRAWERITFDPGDDIWPLWSRDSTSIVLAAIRKTNDVDQAHIVNLYRHLVNGPPGSEQQLLSTPQEKFPIDWSADERFLLYDSLDPKRGFDIWALPLEGDRKEPFAVVQTDFDEGLAQFSPDGTWIAYQSDRTGRLEIYLRRFRGPGGDVRVSIDGGSQVRWNPTGKELFYVASDNRLMAVSIRFSPDGKTVEPGIPVGLFPTSLDSTADLRYRQQYAVSPDGQSFVMHSVVGEASTSPITVILNWKPKR